MNFYLKKLIYNIDYPLDIYNSYFVHLCQSTQKEVIVSRFPKR